MICSEINIDEINIVIERSRKFTYDMEIIIWIAKFGLKTALISILISCNKNKITHSSDSHGQSALTPGTSACIIHILQPFHVQAQAG